MEQRLAIKNWMTKEVMTVSKDENVASVTKRMASRNIGSVIIVDEDNKPIGIFTERDVAEKVVLAEKDYETTKLEEVMTKDIIVVNQDEQSSTACDLIRNNIFMHIPVVDDEGRLCGILSIKDLVGYLKKK